MLSNGMPLGLASFLLLGGWAYGAANPQCGAIEFLTAKQFALFAPGSVLPVVQEVDGSYSAYPHQPSSPYKRGTPIPNFQQQLAGCLPRAASKGEGLKFTARPDGAPGSGVLAIPDAGNGTPVGVWQQFYGDSILVWMANPDFTFRSTATYKTGISRWGMLAGDYNKDGKPDIAVLVGKTDYGTVREPSSLKVLPGKGDGTFGDAITTPLALDQPRAFAQGDFNGDGRPDLALVDYSGAVLILLGAADGTFTSGATFKVNGAPTNIGAADLNKDGKADLQILTGYPDKAFLYKGNGDGTFQAQTALDLPGTPQYVVGTDLNGDGIPDLAFSSRFSSTISILLGNKDGSFAAAQSYLASNQPSTFFPADVNQDGNVDLIVGEGLPNAFVPTEQNGYVSVLFGRGDGTFIAAPVANLPKKFASYVLADVNGDGKSDLVGIDSYTSPPVFAVMLRGTDGLFQTAKTVSVFPPSNYQYMTVVTAGDFDKDGKMDLAFGERYQGGVWITLGNGDGTFRAATRYTVPLPVTALTAGDVNGDGRTDLAVAMKGNNYGDPGGLAILLGQAGGAFTLGKVFSFGTKVNTVALLDLNGDKKLDLVVGDAGEYGVAGSAARVWLAMGAGDGAFPDPVATKVGETGMSMTIGDADGDGKPDIVASTQGANYAWLVNVLHNNGNGTFTNSVLKTDFGPGPVAITDLNGDKIPDLVITHCCGDTDMTYRVGNGDGTFQDEVHFNGGQDPTSVFAEDVTGDGKPELLIMGGPSSGATGTLATLVNISPSGSDFKNVSGVSYVEMPLSPGSVGAAKGKDLATLFLQAPDSSTPQLSLGGTSLTITGSDGNDYPAPLFLVDPTLVLYLIPAEVPLGKATVTLTRADGLTRAGDLTVANVAPALSTINANGLVSGGVLWVSPEGEETWGDVTAPIDLSNINGHVYLVVNGTGFRNRTDLEHVVVKLSGHTVTPVSAGAMASIPGMDQIRFELLPYLREVQGDIQLTIEVDGQASNTATFRVQ